MATKTGIEWTDHTFNPWRGCQKVSPGCEHCYAETLSARNPAVLGEWGPNGRRAMASNSYWAEPLKWDRQAERDGVRRRVFCLSLGDFAEERPELVEPRQRLFELIGKTRNLDWLLLTKRPEVARQHWPLWAGYWAAAHIHEDLAAVERVAESYVLPNVWLGVSVEDQRRADERIPELLEIPAAVRFLSVEPLLGPLDLRPWLLTTQCPRCDVAIQKFVHTPQTWCSECCINEINDASERGELPAHHGMFPTRPMIQQVIVGGESGKHARPMHPDWPRSILDQCQEAHVSFFFKQWGEWFPDDGTATRDDRTAWLSRDGQTRYVGPMDEHDCLMARIGKKAAGRLLDGREWSEFPRGVEV